MYDTTLGAALNYGQIHKAKAPVQDAISYKPPQQPNIGSLMMAIMSRYSQPINDFIKRYNPKRIPR